LPTATSGVCVRKKGLFALDKWHGKRRPEETLRGQLSRSLTTRHSLCV
jgi:hypothetical protein